MSESEDSGVESSAKKALDSLLPAKSKHKYEKAYMKFKDWCEKKKIKQIIEKTMLAYFADNFENLKASTTWSEYSMLRTTISKNDGVDIGSFHNLKTFLSRKTDGYQAKKASILTKEEIYKFIKEAADEVHLCRKVILR